MKKKITALLAGAILMLGAASAWAVPSAEWGIVNPSAINSAPSYDPGTDYGYYIWTDDLDRTSWHMRWMNGGAPFGSIFHGVISLENNTGQFSTYHFESPLTGDISISDPTGDLFFSTVARFFGEGVDGLDFTINQTATPSYVGFDLYQGLVNPMDPEHIFLGGNLETVASLGQDEDFVVAAPVPEPGTMMLLGAGFLGLAIYGKRRKSA